MTPEKLKFNPRFPDLQSSNEAVNWLIDEVEKLKVKAEKQAEPVAPKAAPKAPAKKAPAKKVTK